MWLREVVARRPRQNEQKAAPHTMYVPVNQFSDDTAGQRLPCHTLHHPRLRGAILTRQRPHCSMCTTPGHEIRQLFHSHPIRFNSTPCPPAFHIETVHLMKSRAYSSLYTARRLSEPSHRAILGHHWDTKVDDTLQTPPANSSLLAVKAYPTRGKIVSITGRTSKSHHRLFLFSTYNTSHA